VAPTAVLVQPISSRPAPQQALSEPTVVGVFHHLESGGSVYCARFEIGQTCRDISHWRVVVNSKEFAVDGWTDALKEALAKWPKAEAGAEKPSDLQSGVLLLASEPTAPWVFTARVEAAAHDAGIHRICTCQTSKPIQKVDQIVVDVDFDFKQSVDRRSYGTTDVTSSESLVDAIRNAVKVAQGRGAEPLVRIRAHGACSSSTVIRTEAECREAGVSAIDIAVK
jgi:hypothetical protein